jgi:protein neuralized
MEVRVRSEMAQIHHEIYELRKLAESCIASQVKMQHSIKEEVCSALREAGKWEYRFCKSLLYI